MTYLPCEEINPANAANAAVIWLHGLGANGFDFVPVAEELRLPDELAVRFIFPHAPSIPVTVNQGYVMPAWYDILSFDFEGKPGNRLINVEQMNVSVAATQALIAREISRGIPSDRIVLAGFSQGGAVVYEAALTYPEKLGGLIAMSTYLSNHKMFVPTVVNKQLPIHIYHGVQDGVVPETMGRIAVTTLQGLGYTPEYSTYRMAHEVCMQEINDISQWLQNCLKN